MVVSYVKPETHKGLKRVTRVQCSSIFTFTIFGNLSDGFPFINKMAAARSPCRCFKTRVLHFKVKNTPVKDKKWKEKVQKNAQLSFCGGREAFHQEIRALNDRFLENICSEPSRMAKIFENVSW